MSFATEPENQLPCQTSCVWRLNRPDFVIEIQSESDALKELQTKMQSYLENGIRLGWLIDPLKSCVHIYQPGKSVEILTGKYADQP